LGGFIGIILMAALAALIVAGRDEEVF